MLRGAVQFVLLSFLFIFSIFHNISAEETIQEIQIPSLAPMLKNKVTAVVNISIKGEIQRVDPIFEHPFFERFFNFNLPQMERREREVRSIGSGVIVNAKHGYILTNHHVIKGAKKVLITLHDKRNLEAKIIGSDEETDIAVLKVEAKDLQEITLGKSNELEVGDFVVAIGNPFGLGNTATLGIVSALNRNNIGVVDGYENFIQTDASINPGNSGGALVNLKGELIGINTAIYSQSGGNIGIGFAIPVDMAKNVMEQLIKHGEVKRGQIGINIQDMTPEIKKAMNLDVNGALVSNVANSSPADNAGVKTGDVITKVNGNAVNNSSELKNKVGTFNVGEQIKLTILRNGKEIEIAVKVGDKSIVQNINGAVKTDVSLLKGVEFVETEEGVMVHSVEQNSLARLQKGDKIISVNQKEVKNINDLVKFAKQKKNSILLNIQRGNVSIFIALNS